MKPAFLIAAFLSSAVYGQIHVPSFTQSGTVITIDAGIAAIAPAPSAVLSGVTLVAGDSSLLGATPGLPIRWRLGPGTYQLRMLGFPDDPLTPRRNIVTTTVTVTMSRDELIRDVLGRFSAVLAELQSLAPTFDEIAAALGTTPLP